MTLPEIVKPIAGRVSEVFRSHSLLGVNLVQALPSKIFRLYKVAKSSQPDIVNFRVPVNTNKIQIKHYLESLYGVRVDEVHTVISNGKWKRIPPISRKKFFFRQKKMGDYKKAIVRMDEPFYPPKET